MRLAWHLEFHVNLWGIFFFGMISKCFTISSGSFLLLFTIRWAPCKRRKSCSSLCFVSAPNKAVLKNTVWQCVFYKHATQSRRKYSSVKCTTSFNAAFKSNAMNPTPLMFCENELWEKLPSHNGKNVEEVFSPRCLSAVLLTAYCTSKQPMVRAVCCCKGRNIIFYSYVKPICYVITSALVLYS